MYLTEPASFSPPCPKLAEFRCWALARGNIYQRHHSEVWSEPFATPALSGVWHTK